MFSVDEDIDFSDEDIDFLGSRAKENNASTNSSVSNTSQSHNTFILNGAKKNDALTNSSISTASNSYKPFIRNGALCSSKDKFSLTKTNVDVTNSGNKSTKSKHTKQLNANDTDFILNNLLDDNEDDDELLSQIDLPMGNNDDASPTLYTSSKQKSTKLSERRLPYTNTSTDNEFSFKPNNEFRSDVQSPSFNNKQFGNFSFDVGKKNVQNIKKLPLPFNTENKGQIARNFVTATKFVAPVVTPIRSTPKSGSVTPISSYHTPVSAVDLRKKEHSNSDGKSMSRSGSKQRRFPGPAGLLPTLENVSCLEKVKSPCEKNERKRTLTPLKRETPIQNMISSSQDDDFKHVVWSDVERQVSTLFPNLRNEMIHDILRKATVNQLNNGKVSLLCGLIKSFTTSGTSGKLVIKDPSGEINGTLHKNVLDEYESDLCLGSGVILKDVSVYSPSLKKHYINIIPSNIVQIFPAENDICSQTQQTQQTQQICHNKENVVERTATKKILLNNNVSILNEHEDVLCIAGPSKMFDNENELNSFFSEEFF